MVSSNIDNMIKKVALRELKTIAEISEVTVTQRILVVRTRASTKPHQVDRLIEALKQDYDDVQAEAS